MANEQDPRPMQFKIHGMDCADEVAILKAEVGPVVGGASRLAFDVINGRMIVTGSAAESEQIRDAVTRTGMRAELWRDDSQSQSNDSYWASWGRSVLTGVSGASIALGFVVHAWSAQSLRAALGSHGSGAAPMPLATQAFYLLAIAAGVWQVLPKAWLSLRRLRPDMNLLMTIAVAGAFGVGELLEGATVAFLFAMSLTLESWSVGRARRAVAALLSLAPPMARLQAASGEQEVPPERVQVGQRFTVRPGERIPLDGRVVRGQSSVNQAAITGESIPEDKTAGDEVFAGTINGDSVLEVECTKAAADTTLAQIIRLVGESQTKRAPSEQWVDQFARIYTPAVMLLSAIVLVVPPLAIGATWERSLYQALVLLVIACPCALVISTPVSIVAALAASARNGVLVKGGKYLEGASRLQAVALDKTGTLTEGRPVVVELVPMNGHDERELLERAAALEVHSNHPLAHAIRAYAETAGVRPAGAEQYQVIQGKGATGVIGRRQFWIGSHRYLEDRGQETTDVHARLNELSAAGRSVVVVGNDQHVCGFIAIADAVRPQAKNALSDLRAAGIQHLIMLTGDNRGTAESVAREVGVDDIRAELLPGDKVTAIESLVAQYREVAMVGDGVNDAPALARASLGIAMGAIGSDAAIESADVALMSNDVAKIPWLVRHSRRTVRIIRQNIAFSLTVKAVFVFLTFLGHASLWAAIAADTGASLLVVFNGLRLLRAGNAIGPGEATRSSAPR